MGKLKNLDWSFMEKFIYIILLILVFSGCSSDKEAEKPAETTTTIYELDENGNKKVEYKDEVNDKRRG